MLGSHSVSQLWLARSTSCQPQSGLLIQVIARETEEADKVKEVVSQEEAAASKEAAGVQAIKVPSRVCTVLSGEMFLSFYRGLAEPVYVQHAPFAVPLYSNCYTALSLSMHASNVYSAFALPACRTLSLVRIDLRC